MAKSIVERIIGNALTRVGTNMLSRALSPPKPIATQAMPPVAKFVPLNPQQSFYANTCKGFIRKRYNGGETKIDFVVDMREATPFRSFSHADSTAKMVLKKKEFPHDKRWFCIVQPTIGK